MGYDDNHYIYRILDIYSNNENRLSYGYGTVRAAEISESSGNFQDYLKPTLLAGISYNDVARWIDQKINIFRSTVQNIADNAANSVRRTLDAVITGVKSTANSAWNKANEIAVSIVGKISSGVSEAKRYADSIISSVRSTANSAWSKANEVANSIGGKISSGISEAKRYADSIISSVRSTANSAWNKANEVANSIGAKISSAINTAKGYADGIVSSVRTTATSALSKANEIANSLGGKISSAINTAKSYADSIVSSAKSTLNSAIAAAKDSASNAFNKAIEVANSVVGKVSAAINTAKKYADDVVKSAKDGLDAAIKGVKSTASDALSMAQNAMVSFGLFERNMKIKFLDEMKVLKRQFQPFNDFISNINETVKGIVDPLLAPFKKVVETINATVKNVVDAAVKPFNDFISGFKAKTKEILDTALQNAKDYFKGILDNFRSGIDTIKATIDSIVRNINELLAFRKETKSRLSSLESRLNAVANTYVTKVEFTNFKTDVDKRIKLLNTAVSSINTDLKAAFQSFNLSLIDMTNKVVAAINTMNVNMGNLFNSLNSKLDNIKSSIDDILVTIDLTQAEIIGAIKNLNSDSWLTKIGKLFESATLINKINDISNNLKQLLDKFTQYIDAFNATAQNIFMLYSYDIIFEGYFDKITFKFDKLLSKFDDLIKTVKEIEIPKEENNTTVNNEAETNIWDVLKEALKTLAEFIKNPAKIIELLINFIRDLIVPKDINFFSNFQSEVSNNFNSKLPFVNQAKNSFTAAFNSPKQFNDLNINYNFIKFSGSVTLPLHYLNDFGKIGKPYITGFLVFSFLISMYGWLISRGTKLNDN
jgi:phage-related protein